MLEICHTQQASGTGGIKFHAMKYWFELGQLCNVKEQLQRTVPKSKACALNPHSIFSVEMNQVPRFLSYTRYTC